ncbi:hypothetical protein GX48_08108, partial [Paracoccidioides brasiliensis]
TPARQAPPSRGNGSASRTPRFIFSSNFPSSSASQFAATPRFRFTDRGRSCRVSDAEANLSDVNPSSSALTESDGGQTGNLPQAYPGGDIIHDSNNDEKDLLFQDDTPSPPLEGYPVNQGDVGGGFDIDAEFDAIFPPTPEMRKAKRRRVSLPPPNSGDVNADSISSCPSASTSPSPPPKSPTSLFASPTPPPRETHSPGPSTPFLPPSISTALKLVSSSSTKHPRFLLNRPSNPPSTANFQPLRPSTFTPSSQTAQPPTQRRQPHFILPPPLPRPPEHPQTSEITYHPFAIPGRPRRSTSSITQDCKPGGMTASVRSWLLEAEAMKHASQFTNAQVTRNNNNNNNNNNNINTQTPRTTHQPIPTPTRATNYYLTCQVLDLQHPSSAHSNGQPIYYTPGHPAPVTFITANPINHPNPYPITTPARTIPNTTPSPTQQHQHTQPPPRKILLFGAPMSAPSRSRGHRHPASDAQGYPPPSLAPLPTIAKGDRIGIRRGLVWEMEIEEFSGDRGRRRMRQEEGRVGVGGGGGGLRGAAGMVEKWIVGVEWDVLEWKDG